MRKISVIKLFCCYSSSFTSSSWNVNVCSVSFIQEFITCHIITLEKQNGTLFSSSPFSYRYLWSNFSKLISCLNGTEVRTVVAERNGLYIMRVCCIGISIHRLNASLLLIVTPSSLTFLLWFPFFHSLPFTRMSLNP